MPHLPPANPRPLDEDRWWRRFSAALPMRISLLAVGVVWLLGCTWSFQEQSAFAASKGFAYPHLLPLVIDGFAVSMAGVSWAASLDARPALPARSATVIAVAGSSASNGTWAYLRAHHDLVAVALGVAVPIAANMAFEVLLAELRRQVQRRRGLPAPVAVPYPRLIRLILAPWQTFRAWRTLVLTVTAPGGVPPNVPPAILVDASSERPPTDELVAAPVGPPPARPSSSRADISESAPTALALAPAALRSVPAPASLFGATSADTNAVPDAAAWTPDPADHPSASALSATESGSPRARRVDHLARYLSVHGDSSNITGEKVGEILGIEIAPRTGRRLLGDARQLLSTWSDPDRNAHERQLAVGSGR